MYNTQQSQKPSYRADGLLEIFKIFLTIQGEGPFSGQRAIFVRLGGCNLQCPACDTDYTPQLDSRLVAPSSIVEEIEKILSDRCIEKENHLVVITGGEPFRQNLFFLVDLLLAQSFTVQIETNGTLYQPLPYDYITVVCSPKTGSINQHLAPHIGALKYVLTAGDIAEDDGLPNHALEHPAMPRLARPNEDFDGFIYVQPADERDEEKNQNNLQAALQSVMKFGYILCLQTHKIVNME